MFFYSKNSVLKETPLDLMKDTPTLSFDVAEREINKRKSKLLKAKNIEFP